MKILIAGSSGFLGTILSKYLKDRNYEVVGIDKIKTSSSADVRTILCDLRDIKDLKSKVGNEKIDIIIHLASLIDFDVKNQRSLYLDNIVITKNIISISKITNAKKIIFTSSNSIYLGNNEEFITDDIPPIPIDDYGFSKLKSEELIINEGKLGYQIVRCPNIIDIGRVGMLSILFEIIKNNATLWVVGNGNIRHQSIYAGDLCVAIEKMMFNKNNSIYNIGSDDVQTFKEMYQSLIKISKSNSKIRETPKILILLLMKICHFLRLSPLGPYQFRMLTKNFIFDNSKIKKELCWMPSLTNGEMLYEAYRDYVENFLKIKDVNKSANSRKINFGILGILKYIKI
jgi:UDP-glucose 4-epimerase